MDYTIRAMKPDDWNAVRDIYLEGIRLKYATFQTSAPSYEEWDKGHLVNYRYVAVDSTEAVKGWIALSPSSSRCVYKGVVEISVYIAKEAAGKHIGSDFFEKVISETEQDGIWTLYSSIISINKASIALHSKFGFRLVGTRERIAQDMDGIWRDTVLMERRSQVAGI